MPRGDLFGGICGVSISFEQAFTGCWHGCLHFRLLLEFIHFCLIVTPFASFTASHFGAVQFQHG